MHPNRRNHPGGGPILGALQKNKHGGKKRILYIYMVSFVSDGLENQIDVFWWCLMFFLGWLWWKFWGNMTILNYNSISKYINKRSGNIQKTQKIHTWLILMHLGISYNHMYNFTYMNKQVVLACYHLWPPQKIKNIPSKRRIVGLIPFRRATAAVFFRDIQRRWKNSSEGGINWSQFLVVCPHKESCSSVELNHGIPRYPNTKTSMTCGKIHHEWRCISYWTCGFSTACHVSFGNLL